MKATEAILAGVLAGGSSGGGGGMRLYGPYFAENEGGEEIPAGGSVEVKLQSMMDKEGNALTFPTVPGAIFLIGSFAYGAQDTIAQEMNPPYDDGDEYYPAYVMFKNTSGSLITLDNGQTSISFFSTAEFPVVEGG